MLWKKSVKCYEKILGEKDAMEKAVNCYGKIQREKRFYGKTCEKTRKYPYQNCPSNYKETKVILEEQNFPRNYQNFAMYMCNSVEKNVFHAHFSQRGHKFHFVQCKMAKKITN
jgi:hypothetical protein